MLLSITRLKLRSIRFLPKFIRLSNASVAQARKDSNCLAGAAYPGPLMAFWTVTFWPDVETARTYAHSGAHKEAIPWLAKMCSEAATAHIERDTVTFPSKADLPNLLAAQPKFYRLHKPNKRHLAAIVDPRVPWAETVFMAPPED